jgi:hypothetical protein
MLWVAQRLAIMAPALPAVAGGIGNLPPIWAASRLLEPKQGHPVHGVVHGD